MAAVNPSEPAQPSVNEAYNKSGNPASKEPAEKAESGLTGRDNAAPVDQRIPQKQTMSSDEATPSAMGRGVRGAGPGEDPSTLTDQDMGKTGAVDAEQMGAPGEGKVADAVRGSASGSGGTEPGLESDLDRKKAEQAPMREAMKSGGRGGDPGQQAGPADPKG